MVTAATEGDAVAGNGHEITAIPTLSLSGEMDSCLCPLVSSSSLDRLVIIYLFIYWGYKKKDWTRLVCDTTIQKDLTVYNWCVTM